MKYIVIEYLGEPEIVKDEEGKVMMFDDTSDATDIARERQNAIVVPLAPDLMRIISDSYEHVSICKFEFGEDIDVGPSGDENADDCIEAELGKLLGREHNE